MTTKKNVREKGAFFFLFSFGKLAQRRLSLQKQKTNMTKEEILWALDRAILQIKHGEDAEIVAQATVKAFEAIKDYIESSDPAKKPKRPLTQKPKDWEELWIYVHNQLGMTNEDAKYLWNNWQANGFTRNGQPILDWKAAARAWKAGKFYPSQKQK